ncbi:hypothetical protein [Emcibacter sp. SYSU 3D8]|uniref:hypothetical protein n=1 Tax=Emcibacter sp. SYSU 3D8 TaxID=3133969 RepID=UPI0031FE472D
MTRTEVIYFSPNYWAEGSRYGSFQFEIPWLTLIQGRKLYWIEVIRTYQTPIFRFLISRHDVAQLPVSPYDPQVHKGPIRQVGADWYWAAGWAAEIIVDDAIPLYELSRLTFVNHHDSYCSQKWLRGKCPEKGITGSSHAQAQFLACLLGRPLESTNDLLLEGESFAFGVSGGVSQIWWHLINGVEYGGPVTDDANAKDQIRAAFMFLHAGDRKTARRFISRIDTEDRADRIMREIIQTHFKLPTFDWESC